MTTRKIGASMKIALDGIIGAGKTRLASKAKDKNVLKKEVCVLEEYAPEALTRLFYKEHEKYAFALQLFMLRSRMAVLHELQQDTLHGRKPQEDLIVWDRSWLGDYVFMLTNHLNGNISAKEVDAYESILGWKYDSSELLGKSDIDKYVLVTANPSICKYRLEELRKHKGEEAIALDYYNQLDSMHYNVFVRKLMAQLNVPVLIVPTERCNDANACWKWILQSGDMPCNCHYLRDGEVPAADANTAVYSTRDSVIAAHAKYCDITNFQEQSKNLHPLTVYIRDAMMRRGTGASTKTQTLFSDLYYYDTEYIQLVYAHLGRGDTVYLY